MKLRSSSRLITMGATHSLNKYPKPENCDAVQVMFKLTALLDSIQEYYVNDWKIVFLEVEEQFVPLTISLIYKET